MTPLDHPSNNSKSSPRFSYQYNKKETCKSAIKMFYTSADKYNCTNALELWLGSLYIWLVTFICIIKQQDTHVFDSPLQAKEKNLR